MLPIPLIHTKLALDPPRGFLPRQRLADLFARGSRPKFVLVQAPAGSGKSTLLYQLLGSSEIPVVYYRLSRSDRDIPHFLSYLITGIRCHQPGFGAKTSPCLGEIHDRPPLAETARNLFVHEISRLLGRKLWIVLDEYQELDDSPAIAALVADLVEALPPGLGLIVASRSIPALPLSRWRVRGDLLDVGSADLAFTRDEARELFQQVANVSLSAPQVTAIHSSTEGWAAGLVLASQIARSYSAAETVRLVQQFAGTGSPIYDYLAEQVYMTQPPAMREFLRRSSVLTCLSPGLCNELLGATDAGQVLIQLYRSGLFLQPLEGGAGSFRYHQLFREFLRTKLEEEEGPEAVRKLRVVAGRALEAQRQWDEAILQYIAGGEIPRATELVISFGEQAVEAGQIQRVSQWLRELPRGIIEEERRLLALQGMIALRLGDTPGALRFFERCAAVPRGESTRQMEAVVAKYVGLAHYREGRYADAIRVLSAAMERGVEDVPTRIDLRRLLGVAHRGAGDLARAEQHGRAVLHLLDTHPRASARSAATRVAVLRNLARSRLCQGDLAAAVDLAREAVRVSETEDAGEFQQMRALTILGAALAAGGDFHDAIEVLERARGKGADFYPLERRWVAAWLGNVYRDTGDLATAEAHYEQAGARFAVEFAFLLLRRGQVQRALRMAQDAVASRLSAESPPERAHADVSYALGLAALALRQPAVQAMESAADTFWRWGHGQRYASTCMRTADLWWTMGDQRRGRLWLQRGLGAAKEYRLRHFQWWDPEVFTRALGEALRAEIEVEYATRLATLRLEGANLFGLHRWVAGTPSEEPGPDQDRGLAGAPSSTCGMGDRLEQLLASCQDPQVRAAVGTEARAGRMTPDLLTKLRGPFHLTWKEVLVFIYYYWRAGCELQGPESSPRARVAEELCISENTLKCHVASIRRKLGLPHRIGTVGWLAWGAERGILPPPDRADAGRNSTAG